jgi:ribonucleoside-diphosphate reductase beta chain
VVFLQRRDEKRHATFFDRVAAEVLGLGDAEEERHAAARELAPPAIVELFEERLPAMAAEMAEGRIGLSDGMALYHMTLEGMVLSAGQRALLTELADRALPGVREGVYHVELDERWHIGFGLRCMIDARPSPELVEVVLSEAEDAAAAWGDALPAEVREMTIPLARRRMAIIARALGTRTAA